MNVSVMPQAATAARVLEGKVAIVTGSTSGIGLGIACGLAASGASILLNGFGSTAEIEKVVDELEMSCAVPVAYSGADMSSPSSIENMVAMAQKAGAASTSSSTMPASSTSRRWKPFHRRNGTPS